MSARLAGLRVLVLNWRDVTHPRAGGAERYAHEVSRRWVDGGATVTWLTAREPGAPRREVIDGIEIRRAGGDLSVYARTAARLLALAHHVDVLLDCQNGIPFFAPAAAPRVPVVQLIHHVHQDQFATHFPGPLAALGRWLEGPAARRVYGSRRTVAVSLSTREEVRRRLRLRGPVDVVPNGVAAAPGTPGPRADRPTAVLVSRLVPHKRVDRVLRAVAAARAAVPGLHLDVVGDGPERPALARLVDELGLADAVTLHGRLPDEARDTLLARAWTTLCASDGEGWGLSVLEAAAWGVPCVAVRAAGVRDSVRPGRTGRLVDSPDELGPALVETLTELADEDAAARYRRDCRAWAQCFSWDRTADLLAGVLLAERSRHRGRIRARESGLARPAPRRARADLAVVARAHPGPDADPAAATRVLRATDEVVVDGDTMWILLGGCDEVDARTVLARAGLPDAEVRLARPHEVLAGPHAGAGVPGTGRPA